MLVVTGLAGALRQNLLGYFGLSLTGTYDGLACIPRVSYEGGYASFHAR